MEKRVNPKNLFNKGNNDKPVEREDSEIRVAEAKGLLNALSKNKLNEAIDIKKILNYIPELKSKGLHGKAEVYNQNIPDYEDFNKFYRDLYVWYDDVINHLEAGEKEVKDYTLKLYPEAFKHNQIEKRHFGINFESLTEEIGKFRNKIEEDLKILRNYERKLREGLDTYQANRKSLGYTKTKIQIKGENKIKRILMEIKKYFENFLSETTLNRYVVNDDLVFQSKYIEIKYELKEVLENIAKRIQELDKDYAALI